MKFYFHNKGDFLRSVRGLRRAGGALQTAAERLETIVSRLELDPGCLTTLPRKSEPRIPNGFRHELPGECQLITTESEEGIWLLFVGSGAESEHWLQANRQLQLASNQKKQIQPVVVSEPGTNEFRTSATSFSSDVRPLLQRIAFPELAEMIPDSALRGELLNIGDETDDAEIKVVIEKIARPELQALLVDVIVHLRKGESDAALTRLDLFFGRGTSVIASPTILGEALATGENTELVTDLTSLSQAERSRLFSDDFEPWLLWLHPDQKRAVDEDFDSPAILKGVSGSGKTVILIHRARRLAQKYPNETIGVLTLNRSLARLLENLIRKLCIEGEHERIEVSAYYDYFGSVLENLGAEAYLKEYIRDLPAFHEMTIALQQALAMHQNLANEISLSGETLDDTWDDFWRIDEDEFRETKQAVIDAIKGRGEYDVKAYLRDEFILIRSAFARSKRAHLGTGESYFDYRRSGRAIGLPERARQNILRMLRRYEEYMLAGGLMDELALSQALLPTRSKLADLPVKLRRRCLLIDEFQDFSTLELSLLKQIPTQTENGLFLAGDMVQKVMVKDFNLGNARLDRNYTRTRTITKNYRNSRQILMAADALIKFYGQMAAMQDESIEVLNPELAVRETAPPIALKAASPIDAAWHTAAEWVRHGGGQPWSVCLVTANASEITPAKILAERPASIEAEKLSGDHILNRDRMVVGTLSDVKGFEFSLIVIVGCETGILPDPGIPREERWRDALRLYVAMTRGRDQVVMIYASQPSEFLERMREFIGWNESKMVFEGQRVRDLVVPVRQLPPRLHPQVTIQRNILRTRLTSKSLSTDARFYLLTYFERRVFSLWSERQQRTPLQSAFERWLTPQNLDGLKVSALFEQTTMRRDLAQEIDEKLKPYRCALVWDC